MAIKCLACARTLNDLADIATRIMPCSETKSLADVQEYRRIVNHTIKSLLTSDKILAGREEALIAKESTR